MASQREACALQQKTDQAQSNLMVLSKIICSFPLQQSLGLAIQTSVSFSVKETVANLSLTALPLAWAHGAGCPTHPHG